MEDLRRRDFSLNAIAISLNPASRGLLLDPTNGLSDIEHGEVRALSIHSFTNQPVRLLRALRLAARMGFKLESRTQEWFNLAIERELQLTITPEDAGEEVRSLSREERRNWILRNGKRAICLSWFIRFWPKSIRLRRDQSLNQSARRSLHGRIPPSACHTDVAGHFQPAERSRVSNTLSKLGYRSAEIEAIEKFPEKALASRKSSQERKTKTPIDAYRYIEKIPMEYVAYLLAESSNSAALSKLKAFLHKWRPVRQALPIVATELESPRHAAGSEVRQIVQDVFAIH